MREASVQKWSLLLPGALSGAHLPDGTFSDESYKTISCPPTRAPESEEEKIPTTLDIPSYTSWEAIFIRTNNCHLYRLEVSLKSTSSHSGLQSQSLHQFLTFPSTMYTISCQFLSFLSPHQLLSQSPHIIIGVEVQGTPEAIWSKPLISELWTLGPHEVK